MGRLIILSGPSCVGKSPLCTALHKFYPDICKSISPLVVYHSRSPRPGELDGVDYHFRTSSEIEKFRNDPRFIVLQVRNHLQAVDINELEAKLSAADVLFEGNPVFWQQLRPVCKQKNIQTLSIFISPLSKDEVIFFKQHENNIGLKSLLTDLMRRKLLRRTIRQKTHLSMEDLRDIETRAAAAYSEIMEACNYEYVIVNHDGEDSDNWDAFYYPIGDARTALLSLAGILQGKHPAGYETWTPDLID